MSCTLPVCEDILIFNLYLSFVEELYLPPPVGSAARPVNPNDPVTALLMHKHFGVPMLFFLARRSLESCVNSESAFTMSIVNS